MTSARPPNAASGRPPPTILPRIVRSGRTPNRSCAPPRATRKPVITSSKTSSAPDASHSCRSASRIAVDRRDDAHVPRDRLDDDRGEAFAVAEHGLGDRLDVVVRADDRVGGDGGRHAGRRRDRERREAGAGAREQRVDVAVVAAGELDDAVALREAAREPDRAHRGFGARRDEPDLLDRRHRVGDLLRELDLRFRRGAEASCRAALPRAPPRPSPDPRARRGAAPTRAPSRGSGCRRRRRDTRPRRARRRTARRGRPHASRAPAS